MASSRSQTILRINDAQRQHAVRQTLNGKTRQSITIKVNNEAFKVSINKYYFVSHSGAGDPEEIDTYWAKCWKAKVLDIRTTGTTATVKVQWMYSYMDALKAIEGADDEDEYKQTLKDWLGATELVASDHTDYIDAKSIVGPVSIRLFNETDLDAEWLSWRQWFFRLTLSFNDQDKAISLKPLFEVENPCSCGNPYNPWTDKMYLCKECLIWYHQGCCTADETLPCTRLEEGGSLVDHILKLPIRRGFKQKSPQFGQDGQILAEMVVEEEGLALETDPHEPTEVLDPEMKLAQWQKAQAWGTGLYRLYKLCLKLKEDGEKDLPEYWENEVMDDGKIVAHGWPRDDPDRRHAYAQWAQISLMQKASGKYRCPNNHAI